MGYNARNDEIQIARRAFLTGCGASIIVAPAIVRASSLMPVKLMRDYEMLFVHRRFVTAFDIDRLINPPALMLYDRNWGIVLRHRG